MNNRLQKFLDAENITQSQFADTIGVARASVSHILSGRNKPGFDFIESVSIHYPELNLEWMINGKGKMYKSSASPHTSLFSEEIEPDDEIRDSHVVTEAREEIPAPEPVATQTAPKRANAATNEKPAPQGERTVKKIIVFFSDGTFQEIA